MRMNPIYMQSIMPLLSLTQYVGFHSHSIKLCVHMNHIAPEICWALICGLLTACFCIMQTLADGKTACFCIMQTLAVEGWQAQWPICYICHICYIFDIFHTWDIFHGCDIYHMCGIFRMWTLHAFVSVCRASLCMVCCSFSAYHSDLYPDQQIYG